MYVYSNNVTSVNVERFSGYLSCVFFCFFYYFLFLCI